MKFKLARVTPVIALVPCDDALPSLDRLWLLEGWTSPAATLKLPGVLLTATLLRKSTTGEPEPVESMA